MQAKWLPFGSLLALLISAAAVSACNIPVYRYAIERWRPDPYEFFVFHSEPLSDAERQTIGELTKYADHLDCPTNLTIQTIDIAKEGAFPAANVGLAALGHSPFNLTAALFPGRVNPDVHFLLNSLSEAPKTSGPLLAIRFPSRYGYAANLWTGPLDAALVRRFIDSPARRELAKRLLAGQTAVWVLVESGNQKADDEAAAALTASFAKLAKELKLPVLSNDPEDQLLNPEGPKLKIEFSLLRIARTDPKEEMFVHTLLRTEDDLVKIKEPIAFPVFGRGIVLPAFAGKGITDAYDALRETGAFLVGPCSCQVKSQNPGVDLLMTANWGEIEGPQLAGISEFLSGAMKQAAREAPAVTTPAVAVVPPVSSTPPTTDNADPVTLNSTSPLLRNILVAVVVGLLLLAGLPFLLRAKKVRS